MSFPKNFVWGAAMPEIKSGDMELIAQPLDHLCINAYGGVRVAATRNGKYEKLPLSISQPLSGVQWPLDASCLYWTPKFFFERYGKPIYISENGLSLGDLVSLDGKVHDPQRIDSTQRYLQELKRAIDDGVDIRGYFHWSLMDNYEWTATYSVRFGLVYVNYETQERIPKDSYHWYRNVIARNDL